MELLLSIMLFVAVGSALVATPFIIGPLIRPKAPNPEKSAIYECGEPAIGPSWVQFDLRFYIIALVYLVFDVEVALFYPWAVAWGSAADPLISRAAGLFAFRQAALIDMLVFFGILSIGFAYLWRFGYLDWVGSTHPKKAP